MEESFCKVVTHIFSNWAAMQLAIEHGMAGPNSRETFQECINYIVNYCLHESNVQVSDIEEALEDIMDQEFETICEDNSPKEIANILFNFMQLAKSGNMQQFELEYNNLPTNKSSVPQPQHSTQQVVESESAPMDQADDEWVEVKSRRKR